MIRILALIAIFGALASCTQYRKPQANCFAFRASFDEAEPDCVFTPIGIPDNGVEV